MDETIKCLTIKQPWASFIMIGMKDKEIRSQRTHIRGLIAIHTSKTPDVDMMKTYGLNSEAFVNGHIIGIAELYDCMQLPWQKEEGQWSWMMRPICTFQKQIPYSGNLGMWDLNLEVIKEELNLRQNINKLIIRQQKSQNKDGAAVLAHL